MNEVSYGVDCGPVSGDNCAHVCKDPGSGDDVVFLSSPPPGADFPCCLIQPARRNWHQHTPSSSNPETSAAKIKVSRSNFRALLDKYRPRTALHWPRKTVQRPRKTSQWPRPVSPRPRAHNQTSAGSWSLRQKVKATPVVISTVPSGQSHRRIAKARNRAIAGPTQGATTLTRRRRDTPGVPVDRCRPLRLTKQTLSTPRSKSFSHSPQQVGDSLTFSSPSTTFFHQTQESTLIVCPVSSQTENKCQRE